MIKCSFCKATAFRFKDGWTRLIYSVKGKPEIVVVGCPKHEGQAFEKFRKKVFPREKKK